jgi:hypothetical protein
VWHRRAGKDKTLLNIMVKEMFKRKGTYYYFFPFKIQARAVIWNGMGEDGFPFMGHFPEEVVARKLDQEMRVELKNGSAFQLIGTDDIDRIVGTNPVGCIYSEYALQKPEAWDYIRPILRQNNGWALFNYTPRGMNHGWDLYQLAKANNDWFCELLNILDTKKPDGTPVLTEEDIEKERAEGMSEAMIRQEYYCDFMASGDDVLIPLDLVGAALEKVVHPKDRGGAKVVGVDVARFGDDKSVIIKRKGLVCEKPIKFDDIDNMELASHVAKVIQDFDPDAVFIDAGRGEGVIDRLRQLNYSVIEVNFGGRATNHARYYNKKAEMWDMMKKWLEGGGSIPNDYDLRNELSRVTYSFDNRDRIKLVSKEKMREEGLGSPDVADALALTFTEPIAARSADPFENLFPVNKQTAVMDYDWSAI